MNQGESVTTIAGNDVETAHQACRFFVSYTGVKLPLKLVNPIEADALSNRNTFIRAWFDDAGLLMRFEKMVYGEVELAHRYVYHDNGILQQADIVMLDEDAVTLYFNEVGSPIMKT